MTNLIIILVSVLFSAFFSGMEIAFVSSNKLRIEIDKKQKKVSSRIVGFFIKNPSRYISTMLVGNNIALVIYGIAFARLLEQPLQKILPGESDVIILLIQTIISTLIILLTAEFLPKIVFRINPNNSLRLFSIPILFFYIILYPVSLINIAISNFLLRHLLRIPVNNKIPEPIFNKIDLDHLLTESHSDDSDEKDRTMNLKIFKNALEFSKLKVRDCMIPRTDIAAMEKKGQLGELLNKFIDTGFSRILIYEETIDHVIGYVNSKDMFRKPQTILDHMIPIQFVPETLPVNKLFKTFIKGGKNMAVVVDEFGGTSGLITTEDIIEEIFGEIEDEHDIIDFVEKQIDYNVYLFSGRLEIDYLNEKYLFGLPESEEYDTLAGYIIFHFESIPKKNETLKIGNILFKISKVSSNKIELVEMILPGR
ncbi:MAG: HlyC/CorC family transporter [Bacteroidales bacterium]|nr:HlyC/CorC family transporter [Bacteroidales bacterium]MBN2699727.1 HlyC/CorC family transporter [Bacteroidales bacterium]